METIRAAHERDSIARLVSLISPVRVDVARFASQRVVFTLLVQVPQNHLRMFRFPVVLSQIAASIFWLLIFRESGGRAAFYPFLSCFAANIAIIALVRHKFAVPQVARWRAIITSMAKAMIVVLPSVLAMDGFTWKALRNVSASLTAAFFATALFYQLQPELSSFPVDEPRWIRQAIIVAVASTIALLPFLSSKAPLF